MDAVDKIAPRMRQHADREPLTGSETLQGAAMGTAFIPGVGDALGLAADVDMYLNDPDSRTWMNYLFTAAGLLPVVPALATVKNKAQKIKAYHGSPHDFDEFSMDRIGTGEGAQAYGHGLYFAESEDVAKGYRDKLINDADIDRISAADDAEEYVIGKIKSYRDEIGASPDKDAIADWMRQDSDADGYYFNGEVIPFDKVDEAVDSVYGKLPKGSMYQVEIDATPDELLDWGKPLSEQSEFIKSRLRENWPMTGSIDDWIDEGMTGADLHNLSTVEANMASPNYSDTAGRFQKAGIKGIKYKDGFSRGTDGGTSNYVIFDDRLITISKKYGVAIPIAAGILAKESGEDTEGMFKEL